MNKTDVLKETQKVLDKAILKARNERNEADRKYIVSQIGKDLVKILAPLLGAIAKNSMLQRKELEDILKKIVIEKIDVKVPEIKAPNVYVPPVKIPPFRIPAPQVTVKPADVIIPKEMEIKGLKGLIKTIGDALNRKPDVDFGKFDRDNPMPMILVDEKGKYYKPMTNVVSQGGGGVVTTRTLDDIPAGFEQLTVTLAGAVSLADIPKNANKAVMTVEDATLRYRTDSTDPDANTGLKVFIGGTITLNSRQALTNFRAIGIGANSEVNINYYERK